MADRARHSLRSVIERSASTVPIDVVVGACSRCLATATVTDSIGSGWLAYAAPAACIDAYFQTASATPVPTTATSNTEDLIQRRRFMSGVALSAWVSTAPALATLRTGFARSE